MLKLVLFLFLFIPLLNFAQTNSRKLVFKVRKQTNYKMVIIGTQIGIKPCYHYKAIKLTEDRVYINKCYPSSTYKEEEFKEDTSFEISSQPVFKQLINLNSNELSQIISSHGKYIREATTFTDTNDSTLKYKIPEVLYTIELIENKKRYVFEFIDLAEHYTAYYQSLLRNVELLLGFEEEYK